MIKGMNFKSPIKAEIVGDLLAKCPTIDIINCTKDNSSLLKPD